MSQEEESEAGQGTWDRRTLLGVLVKSGCEAGQQVAGTEHRGVHPGEQQGDEEGLKQGLTLTTAMSGRQAG